MRGLGPRSRKAHGTHLLSSRREACSRSHRIAGSPRRLLELLLSTLVAGAALAPLAVGTVGVFDTPAGADPPSGNLFTYTGSSKTWTVPPGVTRVYLDVEGAQGGGPASDPGAGGLGGRTQALIPVTPGEVLTVDVGGVGSAGVGGWNGGGAGGHSFYNPYDKGFGGGGASDIRQGEPGWAIAGSWRAAVEGQPEPRRRRRRARW